MKNLKYLLLLGLFAFACTDLEEEVLDETFGGDLLSQQDAASRIVAPVYGRLRGTFQDQARVHALTEHPSDELMGPTRGKDWDDNGIWRTLHQHQWDPNHGFVTEVWNDLNQGIARATIALNQLNGLSDPNKDLYIAEVRGMRAFYSYYLLDLYGVVPTRDPASLDFTSDAGFLYGDEAVAFIKTELDAVIPTLKSKGEVTQGRFNKGAAQALLAKLHLNRAVYKDRYAASFNHAAADLDEVIKYCDAIINSNKYQLASDYWGIFGMGNDNHPEIIFATDNRIQLGLGGNNLAMMTLHYNHRPASGFEPWNGFTTIADFYNKWDQTDPRFFKQNLPNGGTVAPADYKLNRGFLSGQQYGAVQDGAAFKTDANGNIVIEALKDRAGNPLIYTVDIPIVGANEAQGVRVLKFEPDTRGQSFEGGVDFPILRYADVYLMRAEAKLRKGDVDGARADVNAVRSARNAAQINTLDLDKMLDERGFEMYWEGHRRQDQIRFGKFEGTWHEKTVSDKNKRVFPIPQAAVDANPNLRQNQGY